MREFRMEIEGLMVEISYEYEEGDKGDYYTPPTGPGVEIYGWSFPDGEVATREREAADYTDEEWYEWCDDIKNYVYNDARWDIIEFEESLKY